MLELKVRKSAPAPAPGAAGSSDDQAPEGVSVSNAAGPVSDNLVEEGDDEASVPGDFEYESDTNPNDDD